MQHYIKYGYGFDSSLLKKEEFDRIIGQENLSPLDKDYQVGCVPFTEGDYEHEWSAIVLYQIGEVNSAAKMISISEIDVISQKYGVISDKRRDKFLEVLKDLNLEHYIDHVELIFYSDHY